MEIIQKTSGDSVELRLEGRLDAYSAEHLTGTIQQLAREGKREVTLEMSEMVFLSSAGIRSLLKCAREMRAIGGTFAIVHPSSAVLEVLQLARLEMLVTAAPGAQKQESTTLAPEPRAQPMEKSAAGPSGPTGPAEPVREGTFEGVAYRVLEERGDMTLEGTLHGEPGAVGTRLFVAGDCRAVEFPEPVTGLGLAALGDGFEECKARFGEFLGVGGAFAYQPTDRGQRADYVTATGQLVARAQVLYGLAARGEMALVAGFEGTGLDGVKLSELARLAVKETGNTGDAVMFVAIAETRGLVGVSLKKSLALASDPAAPMSYPGVRDWMHFTTEPVHGESVALVVGVAMPESAVKGHALEGFVRELAPGAGSIFGHAHAAAFSYRPLRKDVTRLSGAVSQLFDEQALKGVLHLLNDTRAITGNGESVFVRGTLWAGRLTKIDRLVSTSSSPAVVGSNR
jgi:anti-anti-sigma factor